MDVIGKPRLTNHERKRRRKVEEEERAKILKDFEFSVPVIPKTQESPLLQAGFWHQTLVLAKPAPFPAT